MAKIGSLFLIFILLTPLIWIQLTPVRLAKATTWATYQVNLGTDDVYFLENGDFIYYTNAIPIVADDGSIISLFRFGGVDIENGTAGLSQAILSFYALPGDTDPGSSFTVYGVMVGGTILTFDSSSINLPVTSEYVNYNSTTWAGGWFNITVTDIVKEITTQGLWITDSPMAFKILAVDEDFNRFIWSYEQDPDWAPKLYIETYATFDELPYNGGWDNGIPLIDEEGWTVWEVWNGSKTSGLYTGCGTTNDLFYYDYNDGSASPATVYDSTGLNGQYQRQFAIDWMPWGSNTTIGIYVCLVYRSVAGPTAYVDLYESLDGGETWAKVVQITSSSASLDSAGLDLAENGDVYVYYKWSSSGNFEVRRIDYDESEGDNSIDSLPVSSSVSGTLPHWIHFSNSTGRTYVMYGLVGQYMVYHTGSGWTSETIVTSTTSIGGGVHWHDSADNEHFGCLYLSGTTWYYKNRSVSGTWGSAETVFGYAIDANYGYHIDISVNPETGQIGVIGTKDATGGGFTAQDGLINFRNNSTGVWSGPALLMANVKEVAIHYDSLYDSDAWIYAMQDFTDTTMAHIWSYDTSGHDLSNIDPGTTILTNLWFLNADAEGDHYYQIHYDNCTWLDPIDPGDYDPGDYDPYIPPDDPDPPGWDENGMFTRFRVRLYFLIAGLILLVGPWLVLMIMRNSGRGVAEYIMAFLFMSLIGLMLLWSIPGI